MAEAAPYGRGELTLVDPTVRRTWQVDGGAVQVSGAAWQATLSDVVARALEGLGVAGAVDAQLYKLLLYDEGSFFVEHRDSEKADGMFATLVIVLPSLFSGGELVVRHLDDEVTLPLQSGDLSQMAFAAFYADCRHEVRPIIAGHRLALVYNLIRTSSEQPTGAADTRGPLDATARLLARWESEPDWPDKLIYVLEHDYTLPGLSFDRLKGRDDAAARILTAAAAQTDCALFLAMVSIEELGAAEHAYASHHLRRWHDHDDEDEFEAGEVFERSEELEAWRAPDDGAVPDAPLPCMPWEVCPEGALDDLEPDAVRFTEATGNEGATFARSYRRAALVAWPRSHALRIVAQGGLAHGLPHLARLVERWEEAGATRGDALWDEAHTLALLLRDHAGRAGRRGDDYLALLTRLRDDDAIARFVRLAFCDHGRYDGSTRSPSSRRCEPLSRRSPKRSWPRSSRARWRPSPRRARRSSSAS